MHLGTDWNVWLRYHLWHRRRFWPMICLSKITKEVVSRYSLTPLGGIMVREYQTNRGAKLIRGILSYNRLPARTEYIFEVISRSLFTTEFRKATVLLAMYEVRTPIVRRKHTEA